MVETRDEINAKEKKTTMLTAARIAVAAVILVALFSRKKK